MKHLLIYSLCCLLLFGCQQRDKKGKVVDTPTSGELTIAVDEALRPVIEAEISTFNSLYQQAKVKAFYVSEEQAIDTLLKDSVRMAIVTRRLMPEEEAIVTAKQGMVTQVKGAVSGIALIVHPDNKDTLLTLDQFKSILKGEIKTWNQISKQSPKEQINVVFDKPNSGMIRYLNDSLLTLKSLPQNCFAVDSNAAVVDYVSKNPTALGLIDVAWISDRDDATTNKFLNVAKVVGLSDAGEYYQPFQAYISLGHYPLIRDVMMVSREGRSGLATGFITFVAGDKGQRIVLKSGLVPATMPVRIVEVKRGPL
jgi:phosphate transport system substrate-binding protein